MNLWPLQSQCDSFYGNPRGAGDRPSPKWEAENLRTVRPPFRMTYDGKPVKAIRVHKKCASSLLRVLQEIWEAAGRNQRIVDMWGASIFAGSYVYRLKRGGVTLSMHAYGCALDLDPARNAQHDQAPHFADVPQVIDAFEREGWTCGLRWNGRDRDGMHFQAAFMSEAAKSALSSRAARLNASPRRLAPPLKKKVTEAELARAGSRTINNANSAIGDLAVKAATVAAGAGVAADEAAPASPSPSIQEKVERAAETADTISNAIETSGQAMTSVQSALHWAQAHWHTLALAACAIVFLAFSIRNYLALRRIKRARVEDEALGINIGRL
jgi:hypothetical protein